MSLKIYIDGKYYDKEDAKISVYDHGLLYGDGVFEGMRAYNGRVFRLTEHLDRLWDSARAICLDIPIGMQEMVDAVNETLRLNGIKDGYVRLVVTRGVGTLGLDPHKCARPSIIIIADHIALYPQDLYDKGLEIVTVSVPRVPSAALSPRIKSLNYLNNILAKIEGMQAGCVEALMLNNKGELAECTGDNIFFVSDGRISTPPLNADILGGITRDTAIGLARELGVEVCEVALTKYDAYVADECFLTGSAAELIPVVKIDGRTIGSGKPGPMTLRLTACFRELTRKA
jgi:branched-chain amino acid aminotransferase